VSNLHRLYQKECAHFHATEILNKLSHWHDIPADRNAEVNEIIYYTNSMEVTLIPKSAIGNYSELGP
jgi:hypothetical protein